MTESYLPPHLARESAATWTSSKRAPSPSEPAQKPASRWAALWQRHRERRARAEAYVADILNPSSGLPVASSDEVREYFGGAFRRHRAVFIMLIVGNGAAAAAALAIPAVLGRLVDAVTVSAPVLVYVWVAIAALIAQTVFTFAARAAAAVVGQGVLAEAREYVVRAVLRLPLGRVEAASTGDLVTRVTRDVAAMSGAVRFAVPEGIIALTTLVLTLGAMILNSWLLALPTIVLAGVSAIQVRLYLRDAPTAYLYEGATYSTINATLTETVEGARTVETLGMQGLRRRAGNEALEESSQAERYGLTLRNLLFTVMDLAFSLPRVITIILGGIAYFQGWVTLGQVTAGMLYIETFSGPFDRLIVSLDHLQVGLASTTRLLGVASVPPDRTPSGHVPDGRELVGTDLRFAYREGQDVLHGIDIELSPGERLAIVGPSGSGKSTLGRLLAGINGPRTGSVRVGGVDLLGLPIERLRAEVALVTQEHHVFRGTLRENVALARPDTSDAAVLAALADVDARGWVESLPQGLGTAIGSGNFKLTPAQSQQVALARLILADPHTLVLDEATSLIDPRTARDVEGSMNALLTGRSVVAIAHRLHTAHDADRIAVVMNGQIVELGSHDDLLRDGGQYADLWRAWTNSGAAES